MEVSVLPTIHGLQLFGAWAKSTIRAIRGHEAALMGEQTKTRNTEELLREIVDVVVSRVHPKRVILFGSRASGRAKTYADFDLAVEGVTMDARTERLLKETLDETAGIFTVDLVDLDKVEPEFREIVIRTGRVVHGG